MEFAQPRGRQPSIEWVPIGELLIDDSYQRSIETSTSARLIREIAAGWDWDVLDVLKVSRRPDDRLFVIDGQHRLAAARLRPDIPQLPCVLKRCAGPGEEAELFKRANRGRKPMSALDDFRAAVASGDAEASSAMQLISGAGLSVAPHGNFIAWKPGMVSNVSGILRAYRRHGETLAGRALVVMAHAFEGQVLRYCGTLYSGILGFLARRPIVDDELLVRVLRSRAQLRWIGEIAQLKGHGSSAAVEAIARAYDNAKDSQPPQAGAGRQAARPRTFEEQLAAVAAGAKLVEKPILRKPDPDYTLGGIGSAAI